MHPLIDLAAFLVVLWATIYATIWVHELGHVLAGRRTNGTTAQYHCPKTSDPFGARAGRCLSFVLTVFPRRIYRAGAS